MGQGINARGRRQRRRHTVCQQGVEDGDFRDKIHGNDEQFLVGGFLGDDRRSRNLAPRTRRRRNGDDRNAGMRHPAHARVIPDSPAVGVEQAHGLGNVDGPSPAAGYDGPAPFPSEQAKRLPDMAVGGFGRNISYDFNYIIMLRCSHLQLNAFQIRTNTSPSHIRKPC